MYFNLYHVAEQDGADMRLEKMGFTAGNRTILQQKGVEIEGFSRAIRHRHPHLGPVVYRDRCFLAVLVDTFELTKAVPIHTKRNKEKGRRIGSKIGYFPIYSYPFATG